MAMDGMSTSASGLPYHHVSEYYPRKLGPKPDVVPSGVTERKTGPADKPDMVSVDIINFKDSGISSFAMLLYPARLRLNPKSQYNPYVGSLR